MRKAIVPFVLAAAAAVVRPAPAVEEVGLRFSAAPAFGYGAYVMDNTTALRPTFLEFALFGQESSLLAGGDSDKTVFFRSGAGFRASLEGYAAVTRRIALTSGFNLQIYRGSASTDVSQVRYGTSCGFGGCTTDKDEITGTRSRSLSATRLEIPFGLRLLGGGGSVQPYAEMGFAVHLPLSMSEKASETSEERYTPDITQPEIVYPGNKYVGESENAIRLSVALGFYGRVGVTFWVGSDETFGIFTEARLTAASHTISSASLKGTLTVTEPNGDRQIYHDETTLQFMASPPARASSPVTTSTQTGPNSNRYTYDDNRRDYTYDVTTTCDPGTGACTNDWTITGTERYARVAPLPASSLALVLGATIRF